MLKLQFSDSRQPGLWLVEPGATVGRADDNDLTVADPLVADYHLKFLVSDGHVFLDNLAKQQRCTVNGKVLDGRALIQAGDDILIGRTYLKIIDPKLETSASQNSQADHQQAGHDQAPKSSNGTANAEAKPFETPLYGEQTIVYGGNPLKKEMPNLDRPSGWVLQARHDNPQGGGRVYPINGRIIIGREIHCHICLSGAYASRQHAELSLEGSSLRIKDLGSANGTYLNGQVVTEGFLKPGDEITFDKESFKVIGPVIDLNRTEIRSAPVKASSPKTEPSRAKGAVPFQSPQQSDSSSPIDHSLPFEENSETPKFPWGMMFVGGSIVALLLAIYFVWML